MRLQNNLPTLTLMLALSLSLFGVSKQTRSARVSGHMYVTDSDGTSQILRGYRLWIVKDTPSLRESVAQRWSESPLLEERKQRDEIFAELTSKSNELAALKQVKRGFHYIRLLLQSPSKDIPCLEMLHHVKEPSGEILMEMAETGSMIDVQALSGDLASPEQS